MSQLPKTILYHFRLMTVKTRRKAPVGHIENAEAANVQ